MTTLAPSYDPTQFEARLYAQWERSGVFRPSGKGEPYAILLPPPNVTGTLHMGHAFQHTLQDALIRYHRMRLAPDGQRYDTLWQMGTDHAGIATEMVVSRNLAIEGKGETRDSLGRDGFIEKVWQWREQSGHTIERQMRRLGASGDWSRSVFTMDPMAAGAVVEAFVRLFDDGLIYRGQRLVNWDPVLKTAISDLEVVSEEEDGFLWSISYPLSDGSGSLVVATTRPETMLGDTAVMVHPDDTRYAHLVGKTVMLPLTGRQIPVIADDYVDREFGTGVVKVTPAHDKNDYAVWERHQQEFQSQPKRGLINIFCSDASIKSKPFDDFDFVNVDGTQLAKGGGLVGKSVSELIPSRYHGLDRYKARELVLSDLAEAGLLKEAKPHKLQVPRGDRTGQVLEFYLTDQWFVKMDDLAQRGMELVASGSVKFVPPNWVNTYRHWMENIQDWCVSRQLWWGHRIPAWYDMWSNPVVARSRDDAYTIFLAGLLGKHYVGDLDADSIAAIKQIVIGSKLNDVDLEEKLEDNGFGKYALKQDNDVLETWFSSALWPISTMGWPDLKLMEERGFDKFVPSSVLVTGFDIIFFWVARMIFMTDHFVGQDYPDKSDAQRVPFRDVYITGLVRDKDGQKMSKSKGNILDPLDIIDGISLDDLVAKRTTGLMQPKMAGKIAKATRKEFPDGIPAFGADALRFTMAALAGHGRDIKFDLNRAEGYKNFCNKLWNATRFVLMSVDSIPADERKWLHAGRIFSTGGIAINAWIVSRLQRTIEDVHQHYADYRFDLAAQSLYEFIWNEYCDWYIELSKPYFQSGEPGQKDFTAQTALQVLESTLRLLHPLMPFITEELWRQVAPQLGIDEATISLQPYPERDPAHINRAAEADVEWLKSMVSALRRIRSELGVSPARIVTLLVQDGTANDSARIERFALQLKFLNKLVAIERIAGEPPPAACALVGDLKLFVPLAGLIDLDAERARLDKELKRVEGELAKSQGKLASATFVQNAPAAVVEQERQRLSDWSAQRDALAAQRAKL